MRSAPINRLFESRLALPEAGRSEIRFTVADDSFHAAGAAHGTLYFKMLDDAAFYAANGLVSDRFLLTTAFNLHFTKPMRDGRSARRGPLDLGQAAGVRRRGADRRFRGRGMRSRHRHLHALAHRPVRPRRISHDLMSERLPAQLEASAWSARPRPKAALATILKRGDPDRGALILLIASGASIGRASNARWAAMASIAGSRSDRRSAPMPRTLADWSAKTSSALMKIYG